MAELEVTIDGRGASTGARQVNRGLDSIRRNAKQTDVQLVKTGRSLKRTAKQGATLGQALRGLAGVLAIGKVVAYSDAWTLVQNRIRLVTDSTIELNAVTERVFKIAQEARIGLQGTAELYQRVARSAELLGISQERVLKVTKTVSKAITISGVSATAANAAIVQLGQGLASGTLRGDELRSVLEQTPRLARAIADGLGKPIGALRQLGKAGKLSATAVIQALESQADVIEKEFGSINVTVGQAFTILDNSLTRFVGKFGTATGFFSEGARSIQGIASAIDNLGDGFFEGAFAVSQFVNAMAGGFSTLDEQAALMAAEVKASILGIFDGSGFEEGSILGTIIKNSPTGIASKLLGVGDLAKEARDQVGELQKELDIAENVVRDGLDERLRLFKKSEEERKAAAAFDLSVDPEAESQNQLTEEQAKANEKLRKSLERLGEALTKEVATPMEAFMAQQEQYKKLLDASVITQETYNRALEAAGVEYVEQLPAVELYNEQLERGAAIFEEVQTPQEQFMETQRELNELLGVGVITQETFNRALENAREELQKSMSKNDEFAKFMESIADQAARNIQDAFADFLFDPFDDGLEGLLSNFAETLKRMAAEALSAQVFKILGEGLSGASGQGTGGGGGGGGLAGLFAGFLGSGGGTAADGGLAPAGRPTLVGEEGPEILVPRQSGTVIPNGAMGGAMAPEVNVPVTVNNITDPSAIVSALESGSGEKAILNMIANNPEAIKRVLN